MTDDFAPHKAHWIDVARRAIAAARDKTAAHHVPETHCRGGHTEPHRALPRARALVRRVDRLGRHDSRGVLMITADLATHPQRHETEEED